MKLERLFALLLYRLSFFGVLAVSMLLVTSCNFEKAEMAEVVLATDTVTPCEPTDSVDFPLATYTFTSGDIDFATVLETGAYQSSDCLCEVEKFLFVFSDVESDWEIVILDAQGDSLDCEIVIDSTGTAYIFLGNPEDLPDGNLTMFFDFDAGGTDPNPTLEHAGGLCIIENVVGTGTWPLNLTDPYKLMPPHSPPPRDPKVRVFIPTAIGGTPY